MVAVISHKAIAWGCKTLVEGVFLIHVSQRVSDPSVRGRSPSIFPCGKAAGVTLRPPPILRGPGEGSNAQ